LKDGHIYKEIDFEDKGQSFHFTERVKVNPTRFVSMEEAGIYLLIFFEIYKKFHKTESERLIMILNSRC
jgi:hypothetical protein